MNANDTAVTVLLKSALGAKMKERKDVSTAQGQEMHVGSAHKTVDSAHKEKVVTKHNMEKARSDLLMSSGDKGFVTASSSKEDQMHL